MRRRRNRHVPALVAGGIIGAALGTALTVGAMTAPSRGVHLALSTPQSGHLLSTPPVQNGVTAVGQDARAGLAEPDGTLYTLAGSYPALPGLSRPVVSWAARPGGGAWEVSTDGGIFSRGGAPFHGSTGGVRLAQPIVGMASTPTGRGYWLVASDGGVFGFGDARFHGSTGNVRLAQPVVGMTSTSSGNGYRLAAADGGLFSFGDARYAGSAAGRDHTGTVSVADHGTGYDEIQMDGSVWDFSPAQAPARHQLPVSARQAAAAKAAAAASRAISVALSEVGKPYIYGAGGPNAFDCSGLTQYAYARAGVSLPRNTAQQLAATMPVGAAGMQPGDLLFFYADASHVGIYLGDGTMVDAPHSGASVRVESVARFGPLLGVGRPVG